MIGDRLRKTTLRRIINIRHELGFLYRDIKSLEEEKKRLEHSLTKNAVTKEHKPLKIEITEEDENHL